MPIICSVLYCLVFMRVSSLIDFIIHFYHNQTVSFCGGRSAFIHSLTSGQGVLEYEPNGKAAEEIMELFRAICAHGEWNALIEKRG